MADVSPPGHATDPGRCSLRAERLLEPMAGTASTVRSWLLLEQPGPWGRDALLESRLPDGLGAELTRRGGASKVRVVLVRRPGRSSPSRRTVLLARTGVHDRWLELLEVNDPRELLDLDLGALGRGERPGFAPVPEPALLVCAHGRHDPCCAERGRPIATALSASHPGLVWECSHIGGDRFAGNVIWLPEGIYYGRVGPADAARVAEACLRGEVELEHLRGRSAYEFPVQVAEWAVRRLTGVTASSQLPLLRHHHEGDATVAEFDDGKGGRWVVRLRRNEATVPRALTCHVERLSRPPTYEVLAVTRSPGTPAGPGG